MNTTNTSMEVLQIAGLVMTLNAVSGGSTYSASIYKSGISVTAIDREGRLVKSESAFDYEPDFWERITSLKADLQDAAMKSEESSSAQEVA